MKIKTLAAALFLSVSAYSQTIEVTTRNEIYSVLASDRSIKDGSYKQYSFGNPPILSSEGYYHKGLKDSLWKNYTNGVLISEGKYKNGKKAGVWTGYTRGFERLKFDFDTQKLITYVPALSDSLHSVKSLTGKTDSPLDTPPVYVDGSLALLKFVGRNVRYPAIARENGAQGEIIVVFDINDQGIVSNYRLKENDIYGLGAEAIRVFKELPGEWVPGLVKGKPVAAECQMSVLYVLNKDGDPPQGKPGQVVVSANARP